MNGKVISELGKFRISMPVASTAIAGFLIFGGPIWPGLIFTAFGVFFLSAGASSLNHFQEKDIDKKMGRTQNRPIPSGQVKPSFALLLFFLFTLAGVGLMLFLENPVLPVSLGLLTTFWYNGIYTNLKKVTAFAVFPGSMVGALPPLIGWSAAGGDITDTRILMVSFFFFIAQIPHFWLLLLKYGKEYESAGLPSITAIFSDLQIKRLTFIWVSATAVSILLIPSFQVVASDTIKILMALSCIGLFSSFLSLLLQPQKTLHVFKAFLKLNLFVLLVIIGLCIDRFMV